MGDGGGGGSEKKFKSPEVGISVNVEENLGTMKHSAVGVEH